MKITLSARGTKHPLPKMYFMFTPLFSFIDFYFAVNTPIVSGSSRMNNSQLPLSGISLFLFFAMGLGRNKIYPKYITPLIYSLYPVRRSRQSALAIGGAHKREKFCSIVFGSGCCLVSLCVCLQLQQKACERACGGARRRRPLTS